MLLIVVCSLVFVQNGVYLRRPSAVLGMLRNRGWHRCHFLPRRARPTVMLTRSGRRTIDRPMRHILPDVLEPSLGAVFCRIAAGNALACRGPYFASPSSRRAAL